MRVSAANEFIMNHSSNKTVLIVNDSPQQRELLKAIFEQAGYRASTASEGSEGFEIAKSAQFDLIISDVIMPNGDDIELCLWIRSDEKLHSLPILLVSELHKEAANQVIERVGSGAYDYIELPVDPLQLIARAERLIERKRTEEVLRENAIYFRSLIENISDMISILSVEGIILYESPSIEQILGYQPDELIGKPAFDLVHSDDVEMVTSYFETAVKDSQKPASMEFRCRHKTNSWRILESIGKVVNDPSRGTVVIITSRDITERKRVGEKLREKEEWMRAILDGSRDGIVIEDGSGIAYINKSYAHLLGYDSPEELVGQPISCLLPPDEAQRLTEYSERRRRGESAPSIYNFKGKRKDGSLVEVEGTVSTSLIGGIKYIMTAIRDITERKLAESALKQSERDYRTVFEQAHDAIMVFAPEDETVLDVNRRACELYGFSRSEFIGMSIEKISKILASGKDGVKETLELGETRQFETVQYRKDGTEMFLEINAATIIYKGQEAIITVNRDITERRRAEQVLRESEENFRALVRATTQRVWTLKENDDNEDLSQWWKNLTGLTFEKLEAADWLAAVHPEDKEIAGAVWQNEYANKIQFDTSYRVRIKTGEYRHYAVRGVPVFNADGSFRQWVGTFNDITEHKQAEGALRQSQEQLRLSQKLESVGRLAGGIAHDFNNMLTAINGYSELTLRKLEADNPLRHNIEEIKKAGERSALLTHQLLAFSRQQVLLPVVLDLNHVVTDTTKMLERLIGEDIRLETILEAKLGHVTADLGQLTQVIMNLAVNARDAMPKGGSLIIETANIFLDADYAARHVPTKPGLYVMLAVTDTGSGMDEKTQKNIFEPFYTTKGIGRGTGLGLATVYGIVKQSSGYIWVESEIGVGSTFKIYLPCIGAEVQSLTDELSEPASKKAATILIVDDEDLVRALTRRTLEEYGYKVIEASSGNEALTICRGSDCPIDLIITDVVMPQMDGRELAAKLTEDCPQMKVLFTSGYMGNAGVGLSTVEADLNFIQKPFTFETLINKVKQFLDKK